jgi:hypothetical protein
MTIRILRACLAAGSGEVVGEHGEFLGRPLVEQISQPYSTSFTVAVLAR